VRYIIHDAAAREVDQNTFYHTRESGGTAISSAFRLCWDIIQNDYNPAEWNIYPFQFSDGDNWEDDNEQCVRLLTDDILPAVNLFSYGEVRGPRGLSQYMDTLHGIESEAKDEIYDAIKVFLGKGR
jgi:uncharacterized sporulation protein YeaH/YhbH (DUF444 family)